MTTAKSGWFVHSSHRHVASLRRKSPEPSIEVHPALAEKHGLMAGGWAIVSTRSGSVRLQVRFNPALDARVAVSEFGWWEDCPPLGRTSSDRPGGLSSNINEILWDDRRDPVSGSVPLRATLCNVKPDAADLGRWNGQRRFTVRSVTMETAEVASLEFAPADGGSVPEFLPGQHCRLRLTPNGLSRTYSLTSVGDNCRSLSIAVRKVPIDGANSPETRLSHACHRLKPGDDVWLEPPNGVFCPPLSGPRPLVFVAAGIGITPFMGYLETLEAKAATIPDPARVLLLYGCRDGRQNAFIGRLRELSRSLPQLQLITAFSRPHASDVEGVHYDYKGRLDLAPIAELTAQRPLVYVCGSEGFVTETKSRIAALGVPSFDIFGESFISPVAVPPTLGPKMIRIAGSSESFLWSPDQGSILDAGEKAGIAMPSGCRVGQCESCLVTVVDGQFVHLTPAELEERQCLTCSAVPLSQLVIAF